MFLSKRLACLVAILFSILSAMAQPVIDGYYDANVTSLFTLNNAAQLNKPDDLNIEDGVASHQWVYQFTSTRAQDLIINPYDTNMVSAKRFPQATFGYDDPGARTLFVQRTGTDLLQQGDAIFGVADVLYKPGIPMVPFGLGYQNKRLYTYRKITDFGPLLTFYAQYADTLSYIGYGDLNLNNVVYNDAILLKHSRSVTDTSGKNGYKDKVYQIYIPQLGYPMVQLTYNKDGTGQLQFVTNENINVAVRKRTSSSLGIQPNPAQQWVFVSGYEDSQTQATFISAAGQACARPLEKGWVDITGLAPGLYSVQVGKRSSRVVIQ